MAIFNTMLSIYTVVFVHRTGQYQPCGQEQKTPKCSEKCEEGYPKTYKEDKHYGKSYYYVPNNVAKIQTEIYQNGPVEGSFEVYSDFITYKSGNLSWNPPETTV